MSFAAPSPTTKETFFFLTGFMGARPLCGHVTVLQASLCVSLERVVCCRKREVLAAKCWLG